ncbi:MAG: methyltransferase family protein [Gaiellaceae bacterium]
MSVWRHLRAIGLCPAVVTLVVPAIILWWSGEALADWALVLVGAPLIALGLALIAWTVELFATVGGGTLAPWDPTTRLVIKGPYRHVRNPMIDGVLLILLGEAALFGSPALLVWFAVVLAANAAYIPLVEEPGLRERFGEEYEAYRATIPRWLPRVLS